MNFILAIIRLAQLIFSAIVLGLSVSLAKDQRIGSVPVTTGFDAFTGAFGLVACAVGVVAMFVPSIDGLVTWALDALAALCFLAGGIVTVVGLRGTNCSDAFTLYKNELLNGGLWKKKWAFEPEVLQSKCKMDMADTAFMFIACVTCVAALGMSFLGGNKRFGGRRTVVV